MLLETLTSSNLFSYVDVTKIIYSFIETSLCLKEKTCTQFILAVYRSSSISTKLKKNTVFLIIFFLNMELFSFQNSRFAKPFWNSLRKILKSKPLSRFSRGQLNPRVFKVSL